MTDDPIAAATLRDRLIEHLGNELSESHDCTRVWSAWGVGTMGEDDFRPVSERIEDIADGILEVLGLVPAATEQVIADPTDNDPRVRCSVCSGRTFAAIDARQENGSYAPGPERRCVSCKTTFTAAAFAALAA